MQLIQRIKSSIAKRSGDVILRTDIAPLGGASQVSVVLRTLVDEGELVRVSEGIYAKAKRNADGKPVLAGKAPAIIDEVLKKLGISPDNVSKKLKGSRGKVIVHAPNVRIHRHLNLGSSCIEIVSQKKADSVLIPESPADFPRSNVRKYVEQLARTYHITGERTGLHQWTEAVSRAAGDSVQLDMFGRLLVRLKQQQVISGTQMAHLMTNYLSEKKEARRRV